MSGKANYEPEPPKGPPPTWAESQSGQDGGYVPQAQPSYTPQNQDRGYFQSHPGAQQGGYPQGGYHQGGYPQGGYPQGGYPHQGYQQGPNPYGGYGGYPHPQQGGYYQGQQPMYVQQNPGGGGESWLWACLGALCICCTLDMLF